MPEGYYIDEDGAIRNEDGTYFSYTEAQKEIIEKILEELENA